MHSTAVNGESVDGITVGRSSEYDVGVTVGVATSICVQRACKMIPALMSMKSIFDF